ncbi:hypothetical protein [Luteolibacter soli]|uniref:Uncharacterized protein n=1 Tax=Luteolibacter soli TaxID=3135280 RepID=A0ABU9AW51_9BACT
MKQGRILLTIIAALIIFTLGYLTGQSSKTSSTADTSSSPSTSNHSAHASSSSDPSPTNTNTKSKPRPQNTDPIPSPEKNFSRRIVAMMSKGELSVNGVSINGDSLMPDNKVKEFLDLTDDQLETMKQIGRDQLQAEQEHERSITKVLKVSEGEFICEIPADPDFQATQTAALTEKIRKEFGPDVAAVLQTSIAQAYAEYQAPRHVQLTLARDPRYAAVEGNLAPDARAMIEGIRNVTVSVNQNDNGTFMTDERGVTLPGIQGLKGTTNINQPDPFFARYYYLWQQEQNPQK